MSDFDSYVQSLVDNSERESTYVAVMMPNDMEWSIPSHGDSTFDRLMEHAFIAERLIVPLEFANLIEVVDLRSNRVSLFPAGTMPMLGTSFVPEAKPQPLRRYPGFSLRLRVQSLSPEVITGFKAAVLGTVIL